ncbi:MAG: HAMP domain-containing histidine kinase [Ruminococcaceae bacterium]|nr:HAMP domain-containing histidine kinase [Oscillospiraceae bacterium]
MKKSGFKKLFKALHGYFLFFLLTAFIISCCMMLFLRVFENNSDIVYTTENLQLAAKMTFVNVVILSLLFTVFDYIRRRITVERPVKRITEATNRIMQGDFSVRIDKNYGLYSGERFNEIIDCINKMAQELSSIETLRTDFVSNVSHEIKTPLAIMQNYASLLSQPDLSEEKHREYSKAIIDASKRLTELITNILKLNKLENQQIFPENEKYDLGEQLCECLLSFEQVWEEKSIEIETDIDDDIVVNSDRELLSIVWYNLFSNAFKFTDEGGEVSLSVKDDGTYAVVKIKDSGCGISKETGKHIFDKFYQGDTSHATKGNGLGLALVKRVIDITKCDISVESELGRGSTFTVKITK